jgi:hypothetical protein
MASDPPQAAGETRRKILDPVERSMEILFGFIMVLSFTCSLSAATAGREEVRTMVFAALGCNLAWGLVDGVMYLMNTLAERGRGLRLLWEIRKTEDRARADRILGDALPPALATVLSSGEMDSLQRRLRALPEPPLRARLHRDDYFGALGVLLLVFASTFPMVVPFLIFQETVRALRISNLVAVILLFVLGYRLGRFTGGRPWLTGLAMMGIGILLVGITIALGG